MLQLGGIKGDISALRCNLSILHLSPLVSDHWPPISHIGDNSAKLGLGRRNYFWTLITCKVLPCHCWFQLSLCKKIHFQTFVHFPLWQVFSKKVVSSSLEGSMRLISSHPHDAKIGSLDQDHYFTVWCFQDCGEIVERHWADCRRVFATPPKLRWLSRWTLRAAFASSHHGFLARPYAGHSFARPLLINHCLGQGVHINLASLDRDSTSVVETPNLIFVKFIKLLSNSFFVNLAEIWWNSNCTRIWDINLKLALSCK